MNKARQKGASYYLVCIFCLALAAWLLLKTADIQSISACGSLNSTGPENTTSHWLHEYVWNCVVQPVASRRTQFFHLIFMQPMGSNIFSPSTCNCVRLCLDIINPAKMSKLLLKMSGQEIKWERPNGEQGKGHRDWNEAVLTYNRDGVLRFNDRGVHRYDVCVNLWIPYPNAHNTKVNR